MRIRMLGTGYGECKNKKKYSKEYRGRGGVLIDDNLLIDAPADIFEVASSLGFDRMFDSVTDVLISHSHDGHFSPEAIDTLARRRKIRVFASEEVLSRLSENANIVKYRISCFTQFTVGNISVSALPSNHSTDIYSEECFNFLLVGEKNLFYALDGGFINKRAFHILKHVKLDCVILDGALELENMGEESLYHNDILTNHKIKRIFESAGISSERTRYVISHVPTDKRREIHTELSPIAAKHGMILAYDGYFLRV